MNLCGETISRDIANMDFHGSHFEIQNGGPIFC